jgi:hypothetical protein
VIDLSNAEKEAIAGWKGSVSYKALVRLLELRETVAREGLLYTEGDHELLLAARSWQALALQRQDLEYYAQQCADEVYGNEEQKNGSSAEVS